VTAGGFLRLFDDYVENPVAALAHNRMGRDAAIG